MSSKETKQGETLASFCIINYNNTNSVGLKEREKDAPRIKEAGINTRRQSDLSMIAKCNGKQNKKVLFSSNSLLLRLHNKSTLLRTEPAAERHRIAVILYDLNHVK